MRLIINQFILMKIYHEMEVNHCWFIDLDQLVLALVPIFLKS